MKAKYNADYFPPVPAIPILFGRDGEKPWLGPLDAILDTGADATILPQEIAHQLHSVPLGKGTLESQWGHIQPITIYSIDIEIADQILRGVIVAGDPASDEIVLGRNVLNKLALLLDGPKLYSEVLDNAIIKRLRERRE